MGVYCELHWTMFYCCRGATFPVWLGGLREALCAFRWTGSPHSNPHRRKEFHLSCLQQEIHAQRPSQVSVKPWTLWRWLFLDAVPCSLVGKYAAFWDVTHCLTGYDSVFCGRYIHCQEARGGVVVKALRYKPADRGFDSRWCHWNFSVT